ncbi:hypothetical protein AAVH_24395 [Aphelenchoides avenae]|nr:hypothetical protein AAVH_24395 [Aphelenchus avenae]
MAQDPRTELVLVKARYECVQRQLDEANAKVSELMQANEQLRGENKKLAVLSAELAVYKEHIVPGYEKQLSDAKARCAEVDRNLLEAESNQPTHSRSKLPANGERPLLATDKQLRQQDVPSDVSVPNSPHPSVGSYDIQRHIDNVLNGKGSIKSADSAAEAEPELPHSSGVGSSQTYLAPKKRGRPPGPLGRKRKTSALSFDAGSRSRRLSVGSSSTMRTRSLSSQQKDSSRQLDTTDGSSASNASSLKKSKRLSSDKQRSSAKASASRHSSPPKKHLMGLDESDDETDYHWKGRQCPHERCAGPDPKNLEWVACDSCEVYFHCVCLTGKNDPWPKRKSFVCKRCGT